MIIDDYEKIKGIDLTINPTLHQRNWTYYYQQYITAFSCLLDVSRSCNYQTNFRYMAFLFLMRHSLELLLKNQLEQNQTAPIKSISMSHNLLQLANLTGEDKIAFERDFNVLKCDSEGDCFRYLTDNNNVQYFTGTIDSFDTCQNFILYNNLHSPGALVEIPPLDDNKFIRNELLFHSNEVRTLGIITTHYDATVFELFLQIHSNKVSANDIYLPLLFLIRHSIELKIKFALMNIGNELSDKSVITSCHSLNKLWDVFTSHIMPAIQNITDQELKNESLEKYSQAESLKKLMAVLDANSFCFRFPVDRKGHLSSFKPTKHILEEVKDLYLKADTFLCFAVEVLFEGGYLTIGDDIIHDLME